MGGVGTIVDQVVRILFSAKNESGVIHFKGDGTWLPTSRWDRFFFSFFAGEFKTCLRLRSITVGRARTWYEWGLVHINAPCLWDYPSIVVIRLGGILRAIQIVMGRFQVSIVVRGGFRYQ